MTKEDKLDILELLSALESWAFSTTTRLPDYLHDNLANIVMKIRKDILGEDK